MINIVRKLFYTSLITLMLFGCNGSNNTDTDQDLRIIVDTHSLSGDPSLNRDIPNISSKKAQLGMHLFYSKALSGDRDTACVSCHHPVLGGGDGLSLPVGVAAVNPELIGLGRNHDTNAQHYDGGPTIPRNAPTTFNIGLWDSVIFHDGRLESIGKTLGSNGNDGLGFVTPDSSLSKADPLAGLNLVQAQARFPTTSTEEMKGFNHEDKTNQGIRDFIASRMGGYNEDGSSLINSGYWLEKFREAYDSPAGSASELITEGNIAELLGEYQRSQVFVNTPWRNYVLGDDSALSEDAKKGALLFFNTVENRGANCAKCHSGDFFTDEKFHNLAMPQIGRGKGDGVDKSNDFGRFRVTSRNEDLFAFRTPSLINVEVTGPWSHAGAYTSLEEVIKHHLDPHQAISNYDASQLEQTGIQNIEKIQVNSEVALNRISELQKINLSEKEISYLVRFLEALTDPCVKSRECLLPWIPDFSNDIDPNNDQLIGVNSSGEYL